jgi:hypothetical protein
MSLRVRMSLGAVAASIALIAMASLTLPSSAMAGSYTVYGCSSPSGGVAPLDGWGDALNVYPAGWKNSCPRAVFMWISPATAHADGRNAEETFTAPGQTTISRYTLVRAVRLNTNAGYYYQALEDTSGSWSMVEGCNTPAGCHDFGDYRRESASANDFTHTPPSNTKEIQLRIACGRAGGCPIASGGLAASVWLFQSRITLQDNSAPQFDFAPTGGLVDGGALSGPQPVTISAEDPNGSGVYQAKIEVDGHVLQQQVLDNPRGTCSTPFLAAAPCPSSANGTVIFNTAQLSDGFHTLRLLITDAAGNTAAWGPVTIHTVNNPCQPTPTAQGMGMHAAFVERHHHHTRSTTHLTVSYGARPTVVGTLTNAAGSAIAGGQVCVAMSDHYSGAPWRVMHTLSTNGAGHFKFRLGAGPSRTIYFIHRVPDGAVWSAVSVKVRARAKLHVNAHRFRNGQVMVWKGKLPGPIPSGLLALMQVDRGTYWQTFQQIPVPRSGRWVGRYRFQFTTGMQRYTFRLDVPRQSQYPYAPGVSRALHVTVTG